MLKNWKWNVINFNMIEIGYNRRDEFESNDVPYLF